MYRAARSLDNNYSGESMAMVMQIEFNNVFFAYSHDFNVVNFQNMIDEIHGNQLSIIINFTNY